MLCIVWKKSDRTRFQAGLHNVHALLCNNPLFSSNLRCGIMICDQYFTIGFVETGVCFYTCRRFDDGISCMTVVFGDL